MATIIDGKEISKQIREQIKAEVVKLKSPPGLATVLVGEDPASQVYVKNKNAACVEAGMVSHHQLFPLTVSEKKLIAHVQKLNGNPAVHGILVQLPLPKQIDASKILNLISPDKDVDGFHPVNVGRLTLGEKGLRPCTPSGVMKLIESTGMDMKGKNAVVIGRSNIVGKPVALMLLAADATVTICHSKTKDLAKVVSEADIVVAAIGKPEFVKGAWIKKGAVVIDVGINRVNGKLIGDVEFAEASKRAAFITPVPGGVGPMTIAMLLWNTLEVAKANFSS